MTTDLDALFPPLGLAVTSGDLVLRPFRDADLPAYAELLRSPIFPDESEDFVFAWYRVPEAERLRNAITFQWHQRAAFSPESWALPLGVWVGGELVGSQDLTAKDFAQRRTVSSGSWLTQAAQGKGYGGLMRRAVLAFAFDHLGAVRAESGAGVRNAPSQAVSRSCGYEPNGTQTKYEGGRTRTEQNFVVTPETFVRRDVCIEVEGLTTELRDMMGA